MVSRILEDQALGPIGDIDAACSASAIVSRWV
jgi:hypothetical protein